MPRKKKVTTIEELPEEEEQETETTEDVFAEDISSFISSLGPSVNKVTIYRVENGRPIHVASDIPPNLCTEGWIQIEFGPGTYYVVLRDESGRQLHQKTVHIGPPSLSQQIELSRRKAELEAAVKPVSSSQDTGLQVQILREELSNQRQIMLELIRGLAQRDGGSSMSEMLQAFQLAQQTLNPSAMVAELIKVFQQGLSIGSSGGVEKSWGEIIKDVVMDLPNIMSKVKLSTIPNLPQSTASLPNASASDVALDLLRKGIAYLKTKARAGKDPNLWIDIIIDNLDDTQWLPFAQLASSLSFDEFADKVDPEIRQPIYRPFFESLYNGIRDAISGKLHPDGNNGNVGDTEAHE